MDTFGYSKWDHLELSDDSDFEGHPNVDKKSFIRWKQRDIHEKRAERKRKREHLQKETDMNKQLFEYIDLLINQLKKNPEAKFDQVAVDIISNLPTEPVEPHGPSYAQMMDGLVRQVKEEVEKKSSTSDQRDLYLGEIKSHVERLNVRQTEIAKELATMAAEDAKKITSDDLTVGYDSTMVNKRMTRPVLSGSTKKESVERVEVLNQGVPIDKHQESSKMEVQEEEQESVEPSEAAKKFGKLKLGDFIGAKEFIAKHPELFENEAESDGLLIEAFRAEMKGQCEYARQCVDRAQLLSFCRKLGPDGVTLFFQKITTPGHQALKVFVNDVNSTYARIKERAAEIAAESDEGPAGVEQIQLQAVDPNTQISIVVPPENSNDSAEQEARKIFESFSPDLQKALQTGELEQVNKVLAKMSISEAEQVVELLNSGGMLSIDGILDATKEGFELPEHLKPKQVQMSTENQKKPKKPELLAVDDVD